MTDELRDRYEGRRDNGYVNLRAFDRGVKETLGGILSSDNRYVIPIDRVFPEHTLTNPDLIRGEVSPRAGLEGVPVAFSFPEDALQHFTLPYILIRRDDIALAMNRWHPGTNQFRAPARTAKIITVGGVEGPTKVTERQQALPYDITYTIELYARNRGSEKVVNNLGRLFDYVLRIFPPYCNLYVRDSVGDTRSYEAFTESISSLDDVPMQTDRILGFALSLRVEAELDHLDTKEYVTATAVNITTTRR